MKLICMGGGNDFAGRNKICKRGDLLMKLNKSQVFYLYHKNLGVLHSPVLCPPVSLNPPTFPSSLLGKTAYLFDADIGVTTDSLLNITRWLPCYGNSSLDYEVLSQSPNLTSAGRHSSVRFSIGDYLTFSNQVPIYSWAAVYRYISNESANFPMFADETTYSWHGNNLAGATMAYGPFASSNWTNALIYRNGIYINTAVNTNMHYTYQSVCAVLTSPMAETNSSRLGQDRDVSNGFVGDICELIVFSSYLSQSEITEINDYFKQKYEDILFT